MAVQVSIHPDTFRIPWAVRYYEADQQAVVYHGWYLNYFDEAFMAYLEAKGYGYARAHAEGIDWMVVHSEIDWHGSLHWPSEDTEIAVSLVHLGNSSMTIDYAALAGGTPICSARNIYVTVDAMDYTRITAPQALRTALGPGQALRRPRAGR